MTVWTMLAWSVVIGSILILAGSAAWMLRRSRRHAKPLSNSNSVPFSIERYLPMEQLLSADDLRFLQGMPGYRPEIGARWKAERRRVFRLYLEQLSVDFERLHSDARAMVAHSQSRESAPLVKMLVRQRITFERAMIAMRLKLVLDAAGIGSLNPRPLLDMLEAMRLDLTRLATPPAAA